jgi:biotin-(acetyl-CoA carboxylase) ligase
MIRAENVHAYNTQLIDRALSAEGYNVMPFEPVTDSTMNLARTYALDGGPLPVVAYTDHQTAGTGRTGNQWHDRPGTNIMATMIVETQENLIPILADLAADDLCQATRDVTGVDRAGVKYPNDLVVASEREIAKFGGVLVRNEYDKGRKKSRYIGTAIGFGINVGSIPAERTAYTPTSIDLLMTSQSLPSVRRQVVLLAALRALRYIAEETEIYDGNPDSREDTDKRHFAYAALLGKEITITKGRVAVVQGQVVDTKIGQGIQIETSRRRKTWFSFFDNDMKVRVK